MSSIPTSLLKRLTPVEADALRRLCDAVATILDRVYREALLDHQESRGDDAQLYGFRIYKHVRFSVMQVVADDQAIQFVEENGAYFLRIGPLRVRVDSLGHFAHEDVRSAFPDASPTKQSIGRSNFLQLRFELPELDPAPAGSAYSLNALTIGHFGNPREGLVKWYLGAWTELDGGGRTWAWIERQDDAGDEAEPLPVRSPLVPFDERKADDVAVRPRQSA
jgi:hypothetical protein